MEKNMIAVIMAGGLGKRMGSNISKVLYKVCGVPMIIRIINTLKYLSYSKNLEKIIIVVGKYKNEIKNVIDNFIDNEDYFPKIVYVNQKETLGTGHALMCCNDELIKYPETDILILSGDVPMLSVDTIKNLVDVNSDIKIITTIISDPYSYGRIILKDGKFNKIVEEKDCDKNELKILTVNCGIYCIKSKLLCDNFKYLKNDNCQSEYYLTDIIEIINKREKIDVGMLNIDKEKIHEIMGINTINQLTKLEELIKIERNRKLCKDCI
jgi:bifunctional UDP-N-acetylglucosamine pyrophosphorylase/glucosamine-1-phosphate N-acetyltransferase